MIAPGEETISFATASPPRPPFAAAFPGTHASGIAARNRRAAELLYTNNADVPGNLLAANSMFEERRARMA